MSEEVSKHQILQAITRLSNEIQEALDQPKQTEEDLKKKIEKLDAKISVLSQELLDTQAEVKILKDTYKKVFH